MPTPDFQTSYNPARNNTFEFAINGHQKLSLLCDNVPMTGITLGNAALNLPYNLSAPDNQVDLDSVACEFEVSETYDEWFALSQWMYDCSYTGNAHIDKSTTAVLSIKDNNYNPVMTVTYIGVIPVSLSQIRYSTTENQSTEMKCTFIFTYDTIKIEHHTIGKSIEFGDIARDL